MKKLIRVILVTVLLISIFLYCSFACDDNYDVNELNMPQLYKDFLQGRIIADNGVYEETFFSNGEKKTKIINNAVSIEDILWHNSKDTEFNNRITLFDMTGNGIPELHIRTPSLYFILTIRDNKLFVWKTLWNSYELLNNGTFLYSRPGGAPNHIDYIYYILDSKGEELYKIDFGVFDDDDSGTYDKYDIYMFDGIEIPMELWMSLTKRYFEIGSDNINWKSISF